MLGLHPRLHIGVATDHPYDVVWMDRLLDDIDAFYLEHRRCGWLDSGIEDGRVWMTCECGAALIRLTNPSD